MNSEKTTQVKKIGYNFLPLILMVLNLCFFFYIIPEHIADKYSIPLAIIGGIITLILSFWIFFALLPKLYDKIPIFMALFGISTIFIFGFFFILKTTHFNSNELLKNGLLTEAIIVDKTIFYGRRGKTIQNIDVEFTTNKGKKVTANISISPKEYDLYYEGMQVVIRYSSQYPNIARIVYR